MNATIRCALVTAAAALVSAPLGSLRAAETPSLAGSFPLGVYWPWERTEGLAQRNGLEKWAFVERCLDRPEGGRIRRRMGGQPGDSRPARPGPTDGGPGDEARARAGRTALQRRLAAKQLDLSGEGVEARPRGCRRFPGHPGVGAVRRAAPGHRRRDGDVPPEVHRVGREQPAVVVTMWPDSPVYAEQAGFAAVCTDVYPFFSAGNPNGPNTPAGSRSWYRRHAQIAAGAARKAGRTPWIMPQCFVEIWGPWKYDEHLDAVLLPGAILHWRQPSVGEARWQVWSAIGSGVRGFFWYVYLPPPADQPEAKPYVGPTFPPTLAVKEATPVHGPGGLLRPDGGATPEYLAVAEAFAALKPLLPLLKGAVPSDPPFGEVSAPGWIGGLTNPELKRTLAAVVNDDTDHEQTLKVRLRKPHDVRDLRSGQVLKRRGGQHRRREAGPGRRHVAGGGSLAQPRSPQSLPDFCRCCDRPTPVSVLWPAIRAGSPELEAFTITHSGVCQSSAPHVAGVRGSS